MNSIRVLRIWVSEVIGGRGYFLYIILIINGPGHGFRWWAWVNYLEGWLGFCIKSGFGLY